MHAVNAHHMDIKLSNMLIKSEKERPWNYRVGFTDFGLSCINKSPQFPCLLTGTYMPPEWQGKVWSAAENEKQLILGEIYMLGKTVESVVHNYMIKPGISFREYGARNSGQIFLGIMDIAEYVTNFMISAASDRKINAVTEIEGMLLSRLSIVDKTITALINQRRHYR